MTAAQRQNLTFALLSFAFALLVALGFWWPRASVNGFDAAKAALGGETAFAAHAVSPPQATSVTTLTAPKWLQAPTLDGQCSDSEYAQAGTVSLQTQTGGPGAEVKLLHSGLDFYLCFAGLPDGTGQQAVVRVDSDHSRDRLLMPGDYRFSVDAAGQISVTQGMTTGLWTPISVPAGDFAAVVTSTVGSPTWNAELRISLEWVGGYARTDGLSLAVEQADGTVVQQWPLSATPQLPATWGSLALGPLYTDTVTAESAFLDGREGYLVVPYASDLNPAEITIEAWVKVVDGDCGTLVGNGRDASYWLAFCRMIQFGHDGAGSVETEQTPLGDGWHHVAVTMDGVKGIRTFYLDGQVDAHFGWEPAEEKRPGEEKVPEKLGTSDRMLRIGSDRDAPDDVDHLHGYVSELRIWNRARTDAEIQADAFRRLSGAEAGLISLWPFTHGLQDIAGGHDAGLVGNASLAKEARDVGSFPPTPTPVPYTYPTPVPIPAWDSHVPGIAGGITLDGVCRPAEYPDESTLTLEPDRYTSMHLLVAPDALYLCTNILWGGHGLTSTVTLWINRDGQGGAAPGPSDLRLRLQPDGSLTAGTGDGSGYGGAAPAALASQTISDTKFALQEDIRTINSPWWAGEVRIPWEALAPYTPGNSLRLALSYAGTVAGGAFPSQPENMAVAESWPASFDPQQPDTWGEASTEKPPLSLYLPLISRQYTGSSSLGAVGPDSASGARADSDGLIVITPTQAAALRTQQPSALAGWPRPAPTENDFYGSCLGSPDDQDWSNPLMWPILLAKYISYAGVYNAKWPHVDPSFPVEQAEGTLDSMKISSEDSPFIHDSHDLDMDLNLRPEDRWLSLSGGSNLVLETESLFLTGRTFPMEQDHVTVKGRWIFDCGHDPKTEIHSIPIFESDRLVTLPNGIGSPGQLVKVRVAHVWMTSNPHPFTYNLSSLGHFTFNLDYPPPSESWPPSLSNWGNDLLFLRVVEGNASHVAVTGTTDNGIQVTITPPSSSGQHYFELVLGYLDPVDPVSASGKLHHVRLDAVEILDDLDSGWPDCYVVHDCGEWTMMIAVNGAWRRIFQYTTVYDGDPPYNLPNINIPVVGSGDLHLRVIGYENDDPFKGDEITQGGWSVPGTLGQHSKAPGDWRLYYTVYDGYYDGPTALPENDSLYWLFHLGDEPNDDSIYGYNLGTLPVPGEGAPAHVTEHNSYVNQQALVKNGVYLLSNDVDRYQFALTDFATVTFGNLPSGVHLHVDQTYPWSYAGNTPPELENLIGYKSARINVHADAPAVTDKQYTLKVATTWRTLPPDWGEDQDTINPYTGKGGRLVDLFTPVSNTVVITETSMYPSSRSLTEDWAWQHVKGDLDYYDVWIPPVKTQPPIHQPPCEYDRPGELRLTAYDMRLQVVASWGPGPIVMLADENDFVTLTGLNGKFPSGHAYVRVQNPADQRGWYRLQAEWTDAKFYTPVICSILRAKDQMAGFAAINWKAVYFPRLNLPDPSPMLDQLSLYSLGGYKPVGMEQAGALNAVVSSAADQPVIARLYDMNGVLLGEGLALGVGSAGETVPDGQVPQSRLTVSGLQANEYYLMQIVPAFDVGPSGMQDVPVGFTQQGTGE